MQNKDIREKLKNWAEVVQKYQVPSTQKAVLQILNHWTHLDFLFLTEPVCRQGRPDLPAGRNELKFDQMKQFLKGIAKLRMKKVTKYERISAIF